MTALNVAFEAILKLCGILFFVALGAFLIFTIESLIVCKLHELKARRQTKKLLKQHLERFEKELIDTLSVPDESEEI